MGAKSDHFCPFSAYLGVFSPVLLMEYWIFISIVDISANLKNIGINIDIDKEIWENIDIDIDIAKEILENIDIDINIDKEILKNIDIDKEISGNIDIDEISNRLEFGISNRASSWRGRVAPVTRTKVPRPFEFGLGSQKEKILGKRQFQTLHCSMHSLNSSESKYPSYY